MEFVAVQGEPRELARKKGAKAVRREGKIPCVLYGGTEAKHFSVEPLAVREVIYTPEFKGVELDIDGEKVKCFVKDVQYHPVTDEIVHIDFLRLVDGRKVKVDIPVSFQGVAPGLKSGGNFIKKLRKISIKTVPEKLVNELNLDVSTLELGHSLRVRDIEGHEGIEILNNPAQPVASIEVPRILKSDPALLETDEDEEEGEGEEGAEGGEGGETTESEG